MTIRIEFEKRQERDGQELLHMKENETETSDLVLINIEYIKNVLSAKKRVGMCTWGRVSHDSYGFLLETKDWL